MTIRVELPPDVESRVKLQASKGGLDVSDYLVSLIDDASNIRELSIKSSESSFDEILDPIRAGFKETGESEEDIMEFFQEIRDEVWHEKARA